MHIVSIGIDLGKTTFHLVALGERNKVLVRKKFSRAQLLAYTAITSLVSQPPAATMLATANSEVCSIGLISPVPGSLTG
jgi:predicted NBD/HSP70 family sugar kinase